MFVRTRAPWALGLCALAACATQTNDNAAIGSDQGGASADGGASGSAGQGGGVANAGRAGSSASGASGAVGSAGSVAGGSTGSAGTVGVAGSTDSAGAAAGGGGASGSAGATNAGGMSGAGTGGNAGSVGISGAGGSAGHAGASGSSGSAGSAGAGGSGGTGGTGGSAGTGGSSTCTPASITLTATSDSNLSAAATTTNYGIVAEAHIVRGGTATSQRAIFEFDLSALPSGKTLKSAQLQLTIVNNPGQNKTLAAHRVSQNPTRPWVETEVTWQAYKAGSNWTTAGGDFVAQATDTQPVADTAAIGAVINFNVLADAQNFYATPATNFGWLIKDSQEPAAATGENVFLATRDTGTVDYKPKLVVTYCP